MAVKLDTVGPVESAGPSGGASRVHRTPNHSVEIVSDSGEGA